MKHRNLKIAITLVIALGGVVFLASQSVGDVDLYEHVDKVVASPAGFMEHKQIKVHGHVTPGSIQTQIVDQKTLRTFQLEWKGKRIDVRHTGVAPDTFKDLAETVVTGKLVEEDGKLVLVAVDGDKGIMAKCPSKYDGQR